MTTRVLQGPCFQLRRQTPLCCVAEGDVRVLAMLCVELFSAAASSDPEMMCCREVVGGEGWGEGQRGRSPFNVEKRL